MSDKTFRPWDPDQQVLFPPSIKDFVPQRHLAHFVRDVVQDDLDLSAIFARYAERRGLLNVAGEWALLSTVHNLLKLAAVRSVCGS